MAVINAGVFHVVARIARSIGAINDAGAQTIATRSPVETLLDNPDT
jgi:hypothetical protein